MNIKELIEDLKQHGRDEDEVVVIIDEDSDEDDLEAGAVLNIEEAGGWSALIRARTIRVKPR